MKIDKDWNFGGELAKEFYDHISKSIPNYKKIHEYVVRICEFLCFKGCNVLDVGSSTGELVLNINESLKERDLNIYSYEIEKSMYEFLKNKIKDTKIKAFNEDILNLKDDIKYDMVTCIFTLQFINPKERNEVIKKIYNSMNFSSHILLAEKVISEDSRIEKIMDSILKESKIEKGIDEEEILKKEFSLRGCMHCKTNKEIEEEFLENGFRSVNIILKENSFNLYLIRK